MGPPPRSLAADAHDCIMVRMLEDHILEHPPNTRLWRDRRHRWQARLRLSLARATVCRRPIERTEQVKKKIDADSLRLTTEAPYKGKFSQPRCGRTRGRKRGQQPTFTIPLDVSALDAIPEQG
jgi:hypothetical protein